MFSTQYPDGPGSSPVNMLGPPAGRIAKLAQGPHTHPTNPWVCVNLADWRSSSLRRRSLERWLCQNNQSRDVFGSLAGALEFKNENHDNMKNTKNNMSFYMLKSKFQYVSLHGEICKFPDRVVHITFLWFNWFVIYRN